LYDGWRSGAPAPARNEDAVLKYERRNLTHALARVLEKL